MFHSHEITCKAFRPLQDWVILKPLPEKERVRGGVLLPDNVQDYIGHEIVAIGPGRLKYDGANALYGDVLIPTELKVGEYVYLQKFCEGEFQFVLNGEKVFAIRERHLNLTLDPSAVDKPKKKLKKAA